MLLEGTIRDNLDPAHEYTDNEIWEAISKAHISDMLVTSNEKQPHSKKDIEDATLEYKSGIGLNTWVESNGRNFSVGQRQLISLCRALLWKRSILILDEATANIDSKTDETMQEIIRREFKHCTVLTIAHRLNTVMDSDRILVMEQGKVAEFDTPANLLARKSRFAQLVESMQFNTKTLQ
ncbi:ATP-binding cassette glutathione S-conjugate transporter ycf1 [Coemansia sp. RSA 637]|nr:ATP-binding cassette glutathione S-conjugate transporter ycf1 [Coemansia sp. RSA 637]